MLGKLKKFRYLLRSFAIVCLSIDLYIFHYDTGEIVRWRTRWTAGRSLEDSRTKNFASLVLVAGIRILISFLVSSTLSVVKLVNSSHHKIPITPNTASTYNKS